MDTLQSVLKRLNEIVEMEGKESLDQLGSYIVGTLVVDEDADKLCQTNDALARIADLGGNLEVSNGGDAWMQKDWQEVKRLVGELNNDYGISKPTSSS